MPIIKLRLSKNKLVGLGFGVALALQAFVPFFLPSASASSLSKTLVRFDRLSQAVATTGTVCVAASAGAAGTEDSVKVTFPTGFTVSTTVGNWGTNTTSTGYGWPTGALAMPTPGGAGSVGSASANAASGQDVTWKISNITDTQTYCFNWTTTTGLTSVGTAGNYTGVVTTQTSAPATIDTGNYAVTTVGAGADEVTVDATVNPTYSLTLNTTTDHLGVVTTGAVKTSPSPFITATVSTNAANGWYLWAKDSNHGLNSATASYTIPSNCSAGVGTNTTLSAGTEGYNLGAAVTAQGSGSGGTTSIDSVFNGSSAGQGGGLCSTAGYQTVASSTGTANLAIVTMKNNAAISGVTKAATDYQDLETFVGAGLF
jgi:hypothetical protein